MSFQQVMTSLSFFSLWLIWSNPEAGFQRHGKVTFYLTKTETRTKKYLKNSYPKNVDFFPKKNANISKTKRALVLNSIVSENNCVCTYVPN